MKIEVEWKAKPLSGITEIKLSDLGVKNIKEWNSVDKKEQEKRINEYLKDVDEILPKAVEW